MLFRIGEVKSLKQMENKENSVSKIFFSSENQSLVYLKETNTSLLTAGCCWCRRRSPGLNNKEAFLHISQSTLFFLFFWFECLFKVHS